MQSRLSCSSKSYAEFVSCRACGVPAMRAVPARKLASTILPSQPFLDSLPKLQYAWGVRL